jgi:hypothetical protein
MPISMPTHAIRHPNQGALPWPGMGDLTIFIPPTGLTVRGNQKIVFVSGSSTRRWAITQTANRART